MKNQTLPTSSWLNSKTILSFHEVKDYFVIFFQTIYFEKICNFSPEHVVQCCQFSFCFESLLLVDQKLISPYLSRAKFLTEAPPSDGFLSFLPLFSKYARVCVASRVFYKAGTPDSSSRFYKLYPVTIFLYYYVTP